MLTCFRRKSDPGNDYGNRMLIARTVNDNRVILIGVDMMPIIVRDLQVGQQFDHTSLQGMMDEKLNQCRSRSIDRRVRIWVRRARKSIRFKLAKRPPSAWLVHIKWMLGGRAIGEGNGRCPKRTGKGDAISISASTTI